ncbi:MAG: hypothetical protein RL021_215, partial [Bacteroidota bacterium]
HGFLLGIVTLPAVFWLVRLTGDLLSEALGRDNLFHPPLVQLYTLAIAIVFCRLLIVNGKRESTGKGLLLLTLLTAFVYFIYSFKVRHAF